MSRYVCDPERENERPWARWIRTQRRVTNGVHTGLVVQLGTDGMLTIKTVDKAYVSAPLGDWREA